MSVPNSPEKPVLDAKSDFERLLDAVAPAVELAGRQYGELRLVRGVGW